MKNPKQQVSQSRRKFLRDAGVSGVASSQSPATTPAVALAETGEVSAGDNRGTVIASPSTSQVLQDRSQLIDGPPGARYETEKDIPTSLAARGSGRSTA